MPIHVYEWGNAHYGSVPNVLPTCIHLYMYSTLMELQGLNKSPTEALATSGTCMTQTHNTAL